MILTNGKESNNEEDLRSQIMKSFVNVSGNVNLQITHYNKLI